MDTIEQQMTMMMQQLPEPYNTVEAGFHFHPQHEFYNICNTMPLADLIDSNPPCSWSSFSNNNNPTPEMLQQQQTGETQRNSMAAMREMTFRIAAMQPVHIDPESVKPPKRRNVKISKDPQSVAARHRRERISERIRILQRLVPGGTKMDTASMLDEAIHYVKFLKTQVHSLQRPSSSTPLAVRFPVNVAMPSTSAATATPYEHAS